MLQCEYIFQYTGTENKENHQIGILLWFSTNFPKITVTSRLMYKNYMLIESLELKALSMQDFKW